MLVHFKPVLTYRQTCAKFRKIFFKFAKHAYLRNFRILRTCETMQNCSFARVSQCETSTFAEILRNYVKLGWQGSLLPRGASWETFRTYIFHGV